MRASRSVHRNAFTLIELIVVVIILGLLLAVALPSFFGASNSAKDSAAQQYLTIAFREFKAQQAANDGVAPTASSFVAKASVDEPELTFVNAFYSTTGWSASSNVVYAQQVNDSSGNPVGISLAVHSASGTMSVLVSDPSDPTTNGAPKFLAPVQPPVSTAAVAISNGVASHICVVTVASQVLCWGYNGSGQLGNNSTTPSSTAVAVTGLTGATAVAAGTSHTCALLSGGTISCWGLNNSGELGTGNTTGHLTPVAVSGITGAIAVGTGDSYTCALLSGGSVKCWGRGLWGALGNTANGASNSLVPLTVSGISTATALSVAQNDACALLADKTMRCWGRGNNGQLGNGSATNSATPVDPGVANVSATATSALNTCALLLDASVKCWGDSSYGGNGDGQTGTTRLTPVTVPGLTATSLDGNGQAICALSGGVVKCWGYNANGQLGDNTLVHKSTPTLVTGGLASPSVLGGALYNGCAIVTGGKVNCWGINGNGEIGNGTTIGPVKQPGSFVVGVG